MEGVVLFMVAIVLCYFLYLSNTKQSRMIDKLYALPTYDVDGLISEMDKHETKIDKIESGMKHIFGNTYLDDEFPSDRNQEFALLICVTLALKGET